MALKCPVCWAFPPRAARSEPRKFPPEGRWSVSLPMKTLFTVLCISRGDLISGTRSSSHLQRATVLDLGGGPGYSLMMSQARRNHLQTPGNVGLVH